MTLSTRSDTYLEWTTPLGYDPHLISNNQVRSLVQHVCKALAALYKETIGAPGCVTFQHCAD